MIYDFKNPSFKIIDKYAKKYNADEIIIAMPSVSEKLIKEIQTADIFAPNFLPKEKLDVMVYLNYTAKVEKNFAKINICYIQNGANEKGNIKKLYKLVKKEPFDAYFVFSNKIYEYFKKKGEKVYFIPFAIDTEMYHPVEYDKNFDFDVAYVGNDIKGAKRTTKYLLPATKFDFGLFGNWASANDKNGFFRKLFKRKHLDLYDFCILIKHLLFTKDSLKYQKTLARISRGKIAQEDMIKLLSSSKILLNFTLQASVDYDTINYRILEILACKGFVITDRTKIAEKLLKDCVVFTDGNKDLENKIKYYLEHPEEKQKYIENGYNYVLENCTAKARAKEILKSCMELM